MKATVTRRKSRQYGSLGGNDITLVLCRACKRWRLLVPVDQERRAHAA